MKLIEGLTDQSKQSTILTLTDGSKVLFYLEFRSQQRGWFFDVTWNTVSVFGQRLVTSPNVLRQYLNTLPFGIAVVTTDGAEPLTASDFSEGTVSLYLLEGSDLSDVETQVYGAPPSQQQPVSVSPNGSRVIILPADWGPAGGDLRKSFPNPDVIAFHEGGGQQLLIGPIADGQFTKRVGDTLVGAAVSGGGVPLYANMTALRATPVPANNTLAMLAAFAISEDGGGGLFLFLTANPATPDDGGTIIVPGGSPPIVNQSGVITTPGTTATVGAWRRVASMQTYNGGEGYRDVLWFGAQPDNGGTDNEPAFRLALASFPYSSGTLRIGPGQWALKQKWVIDLGIHGGTLTIKGEGPGGTILEYGMTAADTCLIEVKNGFGFGSIEDLQIHWPGYAGVFSNPSVLWVHDTTSFNILNVMCSGLISSDFSGAVMNFGSTGNTNLTVSNCSAVGGFGCQLQLGGSGLVSSCNFTEGNRGPGSPWVTGTNYGVGIYVTDAGAIYMSRNVLSPSTVAPGSAPADWEVVTDVNVPCVHINGVNSMKLSNCFFSGGGPYASFRNSTIARTGSDFTVTTPSAHGFTAGDYILVAGASQAAFNKWWKIASVTSTTITVTFTNALSSDTCTLSSLWSSMYVDHLTESDMSFCFFNTGGSPGVGSIGVFLDGYKSGRSVGEFAISDCICDYGYSAFFLHGQTNSDPGATVGGISLENCRPNGGPRDDFGCFRLEGCHLVTIDGMRTFPGDNNPPGTGVTFNSVVICDGGQAFNTQDIAITGGSATNKNSSGLYPSATIQAFVFDGANVKNVSIMNVGVDASKTVASFVNSAAAANGITVMYADNAGRVQLIDSTGTHAL